MNKHKNREVSYTNLRMILITSFNQGRIIKNKVLSQDYHHLFQNSRVPVEVKSLNKVENPQRKNNL